MSLSAGQFGRLQLGNLSEEDETMLEPVTREREMSADPLSGGHQTPRNPGKRPAPVPESVLDVLEELHRRGDSQWQYLHSAGKRLWREVEVIRQQALEDLTQIDSKTFKTAQAHAKQLNAMFELMASLEQRSEQARAQDRQAIEQAHERTQAQLREAERRLEAMNAEKARDKEERRALMQEFRQYTEGQERKWKSLEENLARSEVRVQPPPQDPQPDPLPVQPPPPVAPIQAPNPAAGGGGQQPPVPPNVTGRVVGGGSPPSSSSGSTRKSLGPNRKPWNGIRGGLGGADLVESEEEMDRDSLAKKPFEFDNSRKHNLRHWLLECEIYFEQKPRKFQTDKTKVLFAGTYTTGLAKEWFMDYHQTKLRGPTPLVYYSWETFREEIIKRFLTSQESMEKALEMSQFKYISNIGDYLTRMEIMNQHARMKGASYRTALLKGLPEAIRERHSRFDPAEDDADFVRQLERAGKSYESYLEQERIFGKGSSSGGSHNTGSGRKRGFQGKGSASGEKKEASDAKETKATTKKGDKPTFSSYAKATEGVSKQVQDQRKTDGVCIRCGKKGHLWKWCRSDANSSASISAVSRKRTRDDNGDVEMQPAPPAPRKRARHRVRKTAEVSAANYSPGEAFVQERGSQSEEDFDMERGF